MKITNRKDLKSINKTVYKALVHNWSTGEYISKQDKKDAFVHGVLSAYLNTKLLIAFEHYKPRFKGSYDNIYFITAFLLMCLYATYKIAF